MKNKIKILTEKITTLKETHDGSLEGGFASIKGGRSLSFDTTNGTVQTCTNTADCTHVTNSFKCSNTGTCFA